MINNALHDEIKFEGSPLTIDTAALSGLNGAVVYETMALRRGGKELYCSRSYDLNDAMNTHALVLEDFKKREALYQEKKKNAPLKGKYAALRDDLRAALDATAHLETTEDGGTSNFDAPKLNLPGWNKDLLIRAVREAGGNGAYKWTVGRTMLGWVISIPSSGQANRRTRRAKAVSEFLRKKGYEAGMYYAMD